jgi:hypothetical protein
MGMRSAHVKHGRPVQLGDRSLAARNSHPRSLSSGDAAGLLALQRTIGNQAVLRLLARRPTAPASAVPIQRFPQDILEVPFQGWAAETANVHASAGGAEGGVFFLAGNTPPVTSVVVKPFYADKPPASAQFAEAVASELGVGVGGSRIVPRGGEFSMIHDLVKPAEAAKRKTLVAQVGEDQANDLFGWIEIDHADGQPNAIAFKIMAAIAGSTLEEMSKVKRGATVVPAEVNRLVSVLNDSKIGNQLGRMLVADALVGNIDRLGGGKRNVGNIMVTTATNLPMIIDTFATLPAVAATVDATALRTGNPAAERLLQEVATPATVDRLVTDLLGSFQTGLTQATKNPTDFDAAGTFSSTIRAAEIRNAVLEGVQQAIREAYVGIVKGETWMQGRLEAAAIRKYGPAAGGEASFERLQANAAYVHAFASAIGGGQAPPQAESVARAAWLRTIQNARPGAAPQPQPQPRQQPQPQPQPQLLLPDVLASISEFQALDVLGQLGYVT